MEHDHMTNREESCRSARYGAGDGSRGVSRVSRSIVTQHSSSILTSLDL